MFIDMWQSHGVYLVYGKIDLRSGIDDLASVVQEQYDLDPYCHTRKERFKALILDSDGFLLLYKRIENGRLQWPSNQDEVKELHTK